MVGHVDECVFVRNAYRDPLASAERAHPSRVAGVELALARLDAAGTAKERVGVHHHIVAGDVSEVEIVHLLEREHKIHTRLRRVVKTSPHNHLKACCKLKQLQCQTDRHEHELLSFTCREKKRNLSRHTVLC